MIFPLLRAVLPGPIIG